MAHVASAKPADTRKINGAIQHAAAFSEISMTMGPIDTQFNMVEPIIEALGWDRSNPSVVQRAPSDNITMMLTSDNGASIAITTIKQGGQISRIKSKDSAMREATSRGIEWLAVTNGSEWWLINKKDSSTPFRKFNISQDDAAQHLSLLSRSSVESGAINDTFAAETRDEDVRVAFKEVLASDQFTELLRKQLAKNKIKTSAEAISLSLDRMAVSEAIDRAPPQAVGRAQRVAKPASTQVQPPLATKQAAPEKPAAASKKAEPSRKAPPAPEWVDGATHKMVRKKNVAFMRLDSETGEATLLPGSIIAAKEGKTIPNPLKNIRKIASEDGSLKKSGAMFKVAREITLDGPKSAAGFAAGTIVPDISCWVDESGNKLDPDAAGKSKPPKGGNGSPSQGSGGGAPETVSAAPDSAPGSAPEAKPEDTSNGTPTKTSSRKSPAAKQSGAKKTAAGKSTGKKKPAARKKAPARNPAKGRNPDASETPTPAVAAQGEVDDSAIATPADVIAGNETNGMSNDAADA